MLIGIYQNEGALITRPWVVCKLQDFGSKIDLNVKRSTSDASISMRQRLSLKCLNTKVLAFETRRIYYFHLAAF